MKNTMTPKNQNQNDRSILIVTCYGHFMSHFNMLVFPAMALPLAEHLNMALSDVLGLSFTMYLMFGLTAGTILAVMNRMFTRYKSVAEALEKLRR